MQGPVIVFLDERLAKALSHPLRQRILQRLSDGGVASPSELAQALGEGLGNVSYHVRILHHLDQVELVRTQQSGRTVKQSIETQTGRSRAQSWV